MSSESPSFIKEHQVPLAIGATVLAAGLGIAAGNQLISSSPDSQANVATAPESPTPDATVSIIPSETETKTTAVKPTDVASPNGNHSFSVAPSAPKVPATEAPDAPIAPPTQPEVKPTPTVSVEKAEADAEVKRMQDRAVGQILNILDMAQDERLLFVGPVYDGPSKDEPQSNYLSSTGPGTGTEIQNPEVVTLKDGTQSICGAVTSPDEIRCVFPVNGKYTIVNNTTGATRELSVKDMKVVTKRVASVKYRVAYDAEGNPLATNPPQA